MTVQETAMYGNHRDRYQDAKPAPLSRIATGLVGWLFALGLPLSVAAQTFDSGSTGADGALAFPEAQPGDVILFDRQGLDPEGDNVYHFTTITIPAGVTVRLSAERLGILPVVWLATGDVQIDGTLDLNGEGGQPAGGSPTAAR
jgi:hypothetical protein